MSCGVFICLYGMFLASGIPIPNNFDVESFRLRVFGKVNGNLFPCSPPETMCICKKCAKLVGDKTANTVVCEK